MPVLYRSEASLLASSPIPNAMLDQQPARLFVMGLSIGILSGQSDVLVDLMLRADR